MTRTLYAMHDSRTPALVNIGVAVVNISADLLLAFAWHTVCELGDRAWRVGMRALVTRQGFFQALRIITTFVVFASWDDLLGTLAFTRPPPLGPWNSWACPRRR